MGFFHGRGVLGLTLGLQFTQELQVALEIAVDALLINGKQRELGGLLEEGFGVGEGNLDFAALAGMAEGEEIVFDGAGTVQTPTVFGYGLRELSFHRSFGLEAFDEFIAESVVGLAIFGGQKADVTGETVAQIVAAGDGFAFDGSGPGGMLGIAAVGFELFFGNHYDLPCETVRRFWLSIYVAGGRGSRTYRRAFSAASSLNRFEA